jgi:hypothetical protein
MAAMGCIPPAKTARAVYRIVKEITELAKPISTKMGAQSKKSMSKNLILKPKKSEILPQKSVKTIVAAELNATRSPISNKLAPLARAISTIKTLREPIPILIGINEKYHAESSKTGFFKSFRSNHTLT